MKTKATEQAIKTWEAHVPDKGLGVLTKLCDWVKEKAVDRYAFASGRQAWCSYCGNSFQTTKLKGAEVCPHCGSRLKVQKSRCWRKNEIFYVQQLTTFGEYQVVRTYLADVWYERRRPVSVSVYSVYDWMFDEKGHRWCFSRRIGAYPYMRKQPFCLYPYNEDYALMRYKANAKSSRWNSGYDIKAHYPVKKLKPWLEKYGIKGKLLDFDMCDVLGALLDKRPHFETVWKLRNYSLCSLFLYRPSDAERLWPQIKIALRHGFNFKDARTWRDHIDLLQSEGFDIYNPKYIAPKNLSAEHRKLIKLREARIEREIREAERRRQLLEEEKAAAIKSKDAPLNLEYRNRIKWALAVAVSQGDISIRPLQDISDFYKEGKSLHHCVFSNNYYNDKNALILGAKVGGKRTETIELNLATFKVVQCRGKHNQDSKFHNDILALMEKAIPKYKKAYMAVSA